MRGRVNIKPQNSNSWLIRRCGIGEFGGNFINYKLRIRFVKWAIIVPKSYKQRIFEYFWVLSQLVSSSPDWNHCCIGVGVWVLAIEIVVGIVGACRCFWCCWGTVVLSLLLLLMLFVGFEEKGERIWLVGQGYWASVEEAFGPICCHGCCWVS